jgi:hypothetical protein
MNIYFSKYSTKPLQIKHFSYFRPIGQQAVPDKIIQAYSTLSYITKHELFYGKVPCFHAWWLFGSGCIHAFAISYYTRSVARTI